MSGQDIKRALMHLATAIDDLEEDNKTLRRVVSSLEDALEEARNDIRNLKRKYEDDECPYDDFVCLDIKFEDKKED